MTLNGVTKPVTLDAKLIGQGGDPWGGTRAGFEAQGKIKLKDFNITTDLGPGVAGSRFDHLSGRCSEVTHELPDEVLPSSGIMLLRRVWNTQFGIQVTA